MEALKNIQTNEFQTKITDELLQNIPEEVQEQLYDILCNVQFIQNLISPNRPRAKDLPRDEKGRIIINLTNPHIIEDSDYFRQSAIHFMKHGCYTFLKPNSNPNSAYRKHWDEEIRRCLEGYVRESDGEWVTGICYWYLNYCPMMVNMIQEGKKKAIRKESMPFFFEGCYWRFHYLNQAREKGHHAIELAKRGAAHPYSEYVYTPEGKKSWSDIKVGDKLFNEFGEITQVTNIPFDDICDIYELTLRDGRKVKASSNHLWSIDFHNRKNRQLMTTLELYNSYKRNRQISKRNPTGVEYVCSIPRNNGVEFPYKETKVDPYTFGLSLGNKAYNKKTKDKFIPDEYKFNSKIVRLNILKGLIDSDGFLGKHDIYQITITSKQLADDILFIARSLGYNSSCNKIKAGYKKDNVYIKCNDAYRVTIYTLDSLSNLPRKQANIKIHNGYTVNKIERTRIIDIKYIGKEKAKCVTVDNNTGLYLINDFILTHNSKSYSLAAIMSHNMILGESFESRRRTITVLTAYQKEYLKDDKDGTLSKFRPEINFIFNNTPFPHLMLKNSPNDMTWQMGYKDEFNREKGSLNMVMAVSAKDDSEKLRGKRGWILYEEMGSFKGLLSLYDITRKSVEDGDYTFAIQYLVGCVCAGTKVWTLDGRNINIEDLNREDGIVGFTESYESYTEPTVILKRGTTKEPITSPIRIAKKPCVLIKLSNGNKLKCSIDHPILIQKLRMNHDGSIRYYEEVFKKAGDLNIGDRVIESREIPIFGVNTLFDPRLVGMLIGDGSYGIRQSPKYSSEDKELLSYIKNKYNWSLSSTHITKKGNVYEDIRIKGICPNLKEIGIYGQVKLNKRLPINYQTLTKENTSLLLSGLYDTDGSVWFNKDGYISLTQSNKEILEQIKILWRKFGVIGTIVETKPRLQPNRKDKNSWFTLVISGRYNCLKVSEVLSLLVPHKRDKLNYIRSYYNNNPSKKQQTYPLDIIVKKITSIENIGEQNVYNLTAGLSHTYLANNIVTHNTAAEDESDFSSAKTLLYSPKGYNIYDLENVYDKKNQGKPTFGFFFPSYINRAGCYNKDGVSDVIKALIEILMFRYKIKYNSTDPKSVLRAIAEDPITPAEAIIKVKAAYFPVQALTERLLQIDSNPNFYDGTYIGQLVQHGDKVEFKPTSDIPIRNYGVENDTPGAIEIFNMPEKDSNNKIPYNRYIIGHDPVDNDTAESNSLSSTIVLDLWTDSIVAEYTGRQQFAEDNYEIVRLLCLFYNTKCLYEAHPYDQIIRLPDGTTKLWGDIKIGDEIFTVNNKTTKVIDIPMDGEDDIYRITLQDGRTIESSKGHIWQVELLNHKGKYLITTEQMFKKGALNKHKQSNFFIPQSGQVSYEHKDVPIDPYTMGLLIAEGAFTKFKKQELHNKQRRMVQFSSSQKDAAFYKNVIPYPMKYIGTKGFTYHLYIDNIYDKLKELGLLHKRSEDKFIPSIYLYNDYNTRLELLKGLMDGDGCAVKKGASIYITTSKQLKENIMLLCRSLGFKVIEQTPKKEEYITSPTNNKKYLTRQSYRVAIATNISIFKLPRKVNKQHIYSPSSKGSKASAILYKTPIINIEYVGKKKCKCITVEDPSELYLIGDYVVTHNCNKKGLYAYFAKLNCTHLLADTPEYLRDKQIIKYSSFGSNAKGVNASAAINNYANGLIRDWLLKPVTMIVEENNEVKELTVQNLFNIKNRALIEELIAFNPEVNVDRIRALGMVMLYREEQLIAYNGDFSSAKDQNPNDYLGNDDFFTSYDKKISKFSLNNIIQ